MDSIRMETVLRYIDEHIQERMLLTDLSKLSGYSPFYFSRVFSETMGLSVSAFVRIRKLQYAIAELIKGEKVIDVAFTYGFESHEGFTRSFTRLFGSSPQLVRQNLLSYEVPKVSVPNERREDHMSQCKRNLQEDMHQIIYEFLRESQAEAKEGFCTKIQITILPDNQIKITDNGRGIPLSSDHCQNRELFTQIFDGHPISNLEYNQFEDFSNLGIQTANSLCEKLCVKVYQNEKVFMQDYIRGIAQHDITCEDSSHPSGMEIMLKPDESIFGLSHFSKSQLEAWIMENCKYAEILVETKKE